MIQKFIEQYTKEPYNFFTKETPDNSTRILIFNIVPDILITHKLWNNALIKLQPYGCIIILGNLPLLYTLIKNKQPILIHKELLEQQNQLISLYLPVNLPNKAAFLPYIPLMQDTDYLSYIKWYSHCANKEVICRDRFFVHIFRNRFNKVQTFL